MPFIYSKEIRADTMLDFCHIQMAVFNKMKKGGKAMNRVEMYSKKAGKNISITVGKQQVNAAMGWVNSAWSKTGGWKKPAM